MAWCVDMYYRRWRPERERVVEKMLGPRRSYMKASDSCCGAVCLRNRGFIIEDRFIVHCQKNSKLIFL